MKTALTHVLCLNKQGSVRCALVQRYHNVHTGRGAVHLCLRTGLMYNVLCTMCMAVKNLRRWSSRTFDMIGRPNLRYVRVEPPLTPSTTTAVIQFSVFVIFG